MQETGKREKGQHLSTLPGSIPNRPSRREFLKDIAAAGAGLAAVPLVGSESVAAFQAPGPPLPLARFSCWALLSCLILCLATQIAYSQPPPGGSGNFLTQVSFQGTATTSDNYGANYQIAFFDSKVSSGSSFIHPTPGGAVYPRSRTVRQARRAEG